MDELRDLEELREMTDIVAIAKGWLHAYQQDIQDEHYGLAQAILDELRDIIDDMEFYANTKMEGKPTPDWFWEYLENHRKHHNRTIIEHLPHR